MCVCVCVCVCLCVYEFVHVYINVFVYVYMCLCVCESLRMFSCMYLMEELRKDYGSITLSQMDFKGPLPSIAAHREKLSPPREVAPS